MVRLIQRLDDIVNTVEVEVHADFGPDMDVQASIEKTDGSSPIGEYAPFAGQSARTYARYQQ